MTRDDRREVEHVEEAIEAFRWLSSRHGARIAVVAYRAVELCAHRSSAATPTCRRCDHTASDTAGSVFGGVPKPQVGETKYMGVT
jgi:hypothetical protein